MQELNNAFPVKELFAHLLKSNMCCHIGKKLTAEMVDEISSNISDSIAYLSKKKAITE